MLQATTDNSRNKAVKRDNAFFIFNEFDSFIFEKNKLKGVNCRFDDKNRSIFLKMQFYGKNLLRKTISDLYNAGHLVSNNPVSCLRTLMVKWYSGGSLVTLP
ncbi:hypothetical protein C7N43_22880 [Sphingobacteriales bacterium UPWRP_1]|nr:hypothetical protein B6N25_14935 [Sphingobacteriales bacterium TSM_CSS]PSJ74684.1 hypothetical protein C7N43_22880 [Sphingobacteriales bacterium UPWRP_1]